MQTDQKKNPVVQYGRLSRFGSQNQSAKNIKSRNCLGKRERRIMHVHLPPYPAYRGATGGSATVQHTVSKETAVLYCFDDQQSVISPQHNKAKLRGKARFIQNN